MIINIKIMEKDLSIIERNKKIREYQLKDIYEDIEITLSDADEYLHS
jgi:hypothetical protein